MPSISRNDHFEDITLTGNLSPGDASRVTNSLIPSTDSAEDLGTAALRWNNVFAGVGGNVGIKPSLNDECRFVSNNGNDANDGRSWGTAKLTVASACASITNQDSTCTTTTGFGTILIAPSFSGTLPSCFSSVTVRCPALTVIGPGLLMVNSSVKTYGTVILGTTNSGYTFLQDGFQMVVQSGGPRAAGAILADSTFTLPDAAEGTASAQSGELAAFVGAGVPANNVIISGGLNTSVSGGILKDAGFTAASVARLGVNNAFTGSNTFSDNSTSFIQNTNTFFGAGAAQLILRNNNSGTNAGQSIVFGGDGGSSQAAIKAKTGSTAGDVGCISLFSEGQGLNACDGQFKLQGNDATLSGSLTIGAATFVALGTPTNGTLKYCSDCTIANPCASGGSGALAKRINGAWVCN